jgi:hypothetical protein
MRKNRFITTNAVSNEANGPDQWLAATGLSTPLGVIASPLHRLVLRAPLSRHRYNNLFRHTAVWNFQHLAHLPIIRQRCHHCQILGLPTL